MIQPSSLVSIANIGAVDSGKSTLMGRLLFSLKPELQKLQSWHQYTDALKAERDTHRTLSVGHQFCDWNSLRLHFRDDPGHEAYAGQTVSGLVGADIVFYVINGKGLDAKTFQWHQELLHWFAPQKVIYLVNQCDQFEWQQKAKEGFENIVMKTCASSPPLFFVSGATGEGITEPNPFAEPLLLDELQKICLQVAAKNKVAQTYEFSEMQGFHWIMNSQINFDYLQIHNRSGALPVANIQNEGATGPLTKLKVQLPEKMKSQDEFLGLVYENEIVGILKPH